MGRVAVQLAHERALAHAGGVGLGHANHLVHLQEGTAAAHRRVGRDGVGGGGEGIDAVVDVAQRAQLGLEHDALARSLCALQQLEGVADVGLEDLAVLLDPGKHLVVGHRLLAVARDDHGVLPVDQAAQVLAQGFRMEQVAHLNGLLHVLVAVDGADAAAGGAVGVLAQALLLPLILRGMDRQHHHGAVGNLEIVGGDLHAGRAQAVDLAAQVLQVNHRARTQQVDGLRMEDAGGQQVQREFAVLVDDRVARVVAALIAHNHLKLIREVVHHAALALVAPVDAHDCTIAH